MIKVCDLTRHFNRRIGETGKIEIRTVYYDEDSKKLTRAVLFRGDLGQMPKSLFKREVTSFDVIFGRLIISVV